MTRVGILAAVIIIVVASVVFGFRKAAREHAAASRAPRTAQGTPLENARPLRKIDPESRKLLAQHIAEARAKRATVGELPADYVRTQRAALEAAIAKCGKLVVAVTITGEPDVGGLVETAHANPCVREALEGVELVAPPSPGRAVLSLSPS